MSVAPSQRSPEQFRLQVALTALQLFQTQGFEATTVDHIAVAAGVSRRTLFRQFGSKDDMAFADHESLLAELDRFLSAADMADPWSAVCDSAVLVIESFARTPELSIQRYQIQRSVPALRDREIITSHRYERLFVSYLRQRDRATDDITIVGFAAAVIATHNYLLRQALQRSMVPVTSDLVAALTLVHNRFRPAGGTEPPSGTPATRGIVVTSYPPGASNEVILQQIKSELDRATLS